MCEQLLTSDGKLAVPALREHEAPAKLKGLGSIFAAFVEVPS